VAAALVIPAAVACVGLRVSQRLPARDRGAVDAAVPG
jgi:hypothetical protein